MKKFTLLLGLILLSAVTTFAQETHLRNSKWFCYYGEADFGYPVNDGGRPQAATNPFPYQLGFVWQSVCDQNGNPLVAVTSSGWVFVNGLNPIGLVSVDRTPNSIIILPKPNHSDRYYIIVSNDGLYYYEVDLVNNKLINQASTPLNDLNGVPIQSSPVGGGIASTVNANGTDYWVTAFANDTLMSYQVTENGINPTPISGYSLPPVDPVTIDPSSGLDPTFKVKIAPNGNTIAVANHYTGVYLTYFDNSSGAITGYDPTANSYLQQIGYQYAFGNGVYFKDVEFSPDGNTVYCVDGYGGYQGSGYGSTYAVSGTYQTTIDNYGTYVALQQGPDGNLYFLDGIGNLYQLDINYYYGWYNNGFPPQNAPINNISVNLLNNPGYNSWYQWLYLPQLVSIDDCLPTATTPTFNNYAPIFAGDTLSPLPTTSTNGITGTWSPALNNMYTTTYTFAPSSGSCINFGTMTITVNKKTPTFDLTFIDDNTPTSYTLPIVSSEGIAGSWNPPTITTGEQTYVFTPTDGSRFNQVSATILMLQSTAVVANDDSFTVLASPTTPVTPSVLDNDTVLFADNAYGNVTLSFDNLEGVDFTLPSNDEFLSCNLGQYNYRDLLQSDGTFLMPYCLQTGTYLLTYKITSKTCSGAFSIGKATIDFHSYYGKKVQEQKQLTDVIPVYPNPSTGVFNIDLTAVEGDYDTLQVYNMLGEIVYESNLRAKSFKQVDLTNAATGFYIAKVSGNSGSSAFQLIKH